MTKEARNPKPVASGHFSALVIRICFGFRHSLFGFRWHVAFGSALVILFTSTASPSPKNVLVVTVTAAYRHSSIPTAEKVLARLGRESGLFSVEYARLDPNEPQFKSADGKVDQTKVDGAMKQVLAEKMSRAALSNYDSIIFANTTGELPLPDKQALLDFV